MTKTEIDLMFDNASRALLEISEEVKKLSEGEHRDKPFVQKKASQLTTLVALHDNARELINMFSDALRISEAVHRVKDAKIMKYETGLSFEKINQLTGLLTPSKDERELDERIRRHVKDLRNLK